MALGVANLGGKGHRIVGRGETGNAVLDKGLEVVNGVLGQLAQPSSLGPVVVAGDADATARSAKMSMSLRHSYIGSIAWRM